MQSIFKDNQRVEAARERLRALAGWIGIRAADCNSDFRIVYVFDTDVLLMYAKPDVNSHYCALLRDERASRNDHAQEKFSSFSEAEVLLADILGGFLVWGRDDPALSSPAHVDEFVDVCTAAYFNAKAEKENAIREIERFIGKITLNKSANELDEVISKILDSLKIVAPHILQAIRLQAAFTEGRIYSIEGFKLDASSVIGLPSYVPSAIDNETGDLHEDVLVLSRQLEKVLVSRARASNFNPKKIYADAKGLAHLCWLNQQLEGDGSKVRVRFVTGAPRLHQLYAPQSTWEGHVSSDVLALIEKLRPELKSLIRHPLGFLDESLNSSLGVWLSDRIPSETNGEESGYAVLESTACELVELLRTALARKLIDHERNWFLNVLLDNGPNADWDGLLQSRIDSLLPHFLAGLAVLQRGTYKSGSVSRNLPPLLFGPFTVFEQFCNKLYTSNIINSSIAKDTKEHLAELIKADTSLYTPLIAIAMWCAAERDWLRARLMASAAVDVADKLNYSGEEARYLKAVATRLTAGRGLRKTDVLSDLEDALDLINDAKKYGRADHHNYSNDFVLRRYQSEEISIQLTRHLFARLGKCEDVSREAERKLFDRALMVFDAHLDDVKSSCDSSYLYEYVLQQLCVSMVHLILIDRYGVSGEEVFLIVASTWSENNLYKNKIERVWSVFQDQCNRLRSVKREEVGGLMPVVSSFVGLVEVVFSLEFVDSLPVSEKIHIAEKVRQFGDKKHRIASIDDMRINFLCKIAERKVRHVN